MLSISLPIRLMLLLVVAIGVYSVTRHYTSSKVPSTASAAELVSASSATAADEYPKSTGSTATTKRASFLYLPAEPVGGKLRGVVELGASGFNSFIVRTDAKRHWKLLKAEFDNSLLMENMASNEDIRRRLRAYIAKMLDYGVAGQDVHFLVSSGAQKANTTRKIVKELTALGYVVNTMTPTKEAALGLGVVLPPTYQDKAFVVDMGSGGTEISWLAAGVLNSVDSYGSKYYEEGISAATVAAEVKRKAAQVPASLRRTCFIIGGVPYELAKQVRTGNERYTVLDAPDAYHFDKAKTIAGLTIYRSIAEATGCKRFVFDWDANFTIGYLLSLPQ